MTDDLDGGSPAGGDPVADAVAAVDAQLSQAPEAVRNTPEFRALAQQLRTTARENGTLKAAQARIREEAETSRLAAEAQRQAALESQLTDILGADGIAAYQEVAELGATDPVAAARRFAELTKASAQSAGQPGPTPLAAPTAPEGVLVPAQTPPPPSGGVDANAPLMNAQGEDIAALTGQLDARYAAAVERNQNTATRSRVTMRERADAMIAYLGSAYVKAYHAIRTPPR